ncbi:glycosyltransferase family 4 protein [Kerstersia gyiorum]|uniref:glycosyltransferase n=1 Tax=Kerstersia gyiorum TaxID=206506 RepID=UPI0010713D69|nr:glycosyltransferase [Kerstersia gyiorum]QBR40824.1 glycosyltransferase family 4 protein [Kerstersia gyiorum]
MHVLVIPSWFPTNSNDTNGSFFKEQAIALSKIHKVGVIYPNIASARKRIGFLKVVEEQVGCINTFIGSATNFLPKSRKAASRKFVQTGLHLFRKYSEQNGWPDIIHAHSLIYAGLLAREIKKTYGIPYVVTEHRTAFARGALSDHEISVASLANRDADVLIGVSTQFCDFLYSFFERYGISREWKYIPNIVSDAFSTASLGNESDEFVFVNVAYLEKKKRHDVLIRAFSEIASKIPAKLVIGGGGPALSNLKTLVSELGLANRVEFTGKLTRQQVLSTMQSSNVFVLSSEVETFGVVLVEASALGLPLISTRSGGPESIVSKLNGLLVEVNNVSALAEAMLKIYETYDSYLKKKIKEDCLSRFSESIVVDKITSVYESVLKGKAR